MATFGKRKKPPKKSAVDRSKHPKHFLFLNKLGQDARKALKPRK